MKLQRTFDTSCLIEGTNVPANPENRDLCTNHPCKQVGMGNTPPHLNFQERYPPLYNVC